MKLRPLVLLVVLPLVAVALAAPTAAAPGQTWNVESGAAPGGDGSASRPFDALASAEAASGEGDTIIVLPSEGVLDGGIQLQPGQTLVGAGQSSRITNTTTNLDGDAVRLADHTTVRNLRIINARRGAVYGQDVTGVDVSDNDVSGQNTSCTRGFHIPAFRAPTNVPGVGIPIPNGLHNGWAAIMIDAEHLTDATVRVNGNVVHDAECGDGIDVRASGTASMNATITDNDVHSLRQGKGLTSLLAIGLQARDTARLTAVVDGNTQANLGNDDDVNVGPEGADSEGVFINGVGPSRLHATVTDNRYTNERGIGGFSANGLEMVSMGKGSRVTTVVRDSSFSGSPGDVIEEGALGTDARLEMVLERVTAARSTGVGNTVVLPFNNGDCMLAGSLGARNDVRLTVRESVFRDCSNNGLSLGSNVVNGSGPTKNLSLEVDRSTITGNRGGNLGIRNFTKLDSLSVKVQRSNLAGSRSIGSAVADFSAEDLGRTTTSVIDIGGGALASAGGNCLRGGLLAANIVRYRVSAKGNWWGRPGGPGPLRTFTLGGRLDTSQPLSTAPPYCD
ncbi:MAG: hypothetical protein ACRDOT_04380 [Aeromicrobium sp.]